MRLLPAQQERQLEDVGVTLRSSKGKEAIPCECVLVSMPWPWSSGASQEIQLSRELGLAVLLPKILVAWNARYTRLLGPYQS